MFEHILVPLDGSALAECVLPHTVALSQALGGRVTLLRVAESSGTAAPTVDAYGWHIHKAEASAYLDAVSARLQRETGLETRTVVQEGRAAESILKFAAGEGVDLIVLSSHGRSGLSRWNISSIVQKIVWQAYLPVMIVRAYQPLPADLSEFRYRKLMVPLDGSLRAEYVLPLAVTLARFHRAELLLTHVVARPYLACTATPEAEDLALAEQLTERNRRVASRYLEEHRARLAAEVEVRSRLVVSEDVATALHEVVEEEGVDLIVLCAHGHSARTRWPYGNIVASFITYGTTPLLIVQDLAPHEVERSRAAILAQERTGH